MMAAPLVLGVLVVLSAALLATAPSVRHGPATRRRLRGSIAVQPGKVRRGGPPGGATVAGALGAVRLRLLARRTGRRYEHRLPAALEALARAMRAGTPLPGALRSAASAVDGAVAADILAIVSDLDHGVPVSGALHGWCERRPLPGVRLAVASLVVGTELGGSRARAVDRVAAGLRERAAAAREVVALASQARLSALVVCLAPVLFALLGVAGNREMASFLFLSPPGWGCLLAGAALDAAAAWWMLRIVERAAR